MLPAKPDSALVVQQQKIFLKIIIDVCSFEWIISEDGCFNNMPNLIFMKRHSNSLPILNAIFKTKRKKLPISNYALFHDVFLITLTTFTKDIAV